MQQPGPAARSRAYYGTATRTDLLVLLCCIGMFALFAGYALYLIVLLPADYDTRLPFTGTFLDRIIVAIAIVVIVLIFFVLRRRDRQGRNRPEKNTQ